MPNPRVRRLRIHFVAVGGAWVLFAMGWIKVLRSTSSATMLLSVVVVGVILAAVVAVTAWWIRHNVAIFRRKGPRRRVRGADLVPTTDALGRMLVADWEAVRSSPMVLVVATDGTKDLIVARSGP